MGIISVLGFLDILGTTKHGHSEYICIVGIKYSAD